MPGYKHTKVPPSNLGSYTLGLLQGRRSKGDLEFELEPGIDLVLRCWREIISASIAQQPRISPCKNLAARTPAVWLLTFLEISRVLEVTRFQCPVMTETWAIFTLLWRLCLAFPVLTRFYQGSLTKLCEYIPAADRPSSWYRFPPS